MLEGLIRFFAESIRGTFEVSFVVLIKKIGSWTAWLVSIGHWDVDEDSWSAVAIGVVVFFAAIVGAAVWRGYS